MSLYDHSQGMISVQKPDYYDFCDINGEWWRQQKLPGAQWWLLREPSIILRPGLDPPGFFSPQQSYQQPPAQSQILEPGHPYQSPQRKYYSGHVQSLSGSAIPAYSLQNEAAPAPNTVYHDTRDRQNVRVDQHKNYTPANRPSIISGTSGDKEALDSSYFIRPHPKEFFKVGKVFALLWHEQAGSNGTALSESCFKVILGEYVFSHIRRMVVVQEQHGCCWCLPIHTYRKRGSAKMGIDVQSHAIIYMKGEKPYPTELNAKTIKTPLEVVPDSPREKLHPLSLLNFGKVYTVEHNVKVKSIGQISRKSMPNFKVYWRQGFGDYSGNSLYDSWNVIGAVEPQPQGKSLLSTGYKSTATLETVHETTLIAFQSCSYRCNIEITLCWELFSFMKVNFERGQRLGPILVLNGTSEIVQALTCEKYMQSRWPRISCKLLEILETALDALAEEVSYSNYIKIGDLHITLYSQHDFGKDSKYETAVVTADGTPSLVADLVEALSWLASTLREPAHPGPSSSDVSVEIERPANNETVSCNVVLSELEPLAICGTYCWHPLFKRPLVSTGRLIDEPRTGTGLEISLENVIHLSGADTLIYHENGLLFMGTSCLLVPVEKLQDNALQWHLVTSKDEPISVWEVELQSVEALDISKPEDILNAPTHFLGLWKSAKVVLGTSEPDYTRLEWTTLPERKTSWFFSGMSFSLNGPAGVGTTANFTIAKAQFTNRSKKPNLVEELLSLKTTPIILYDQEIGDGIAWLVPALSVLLHMAHLYVRKQNLNVNLPVAEASSDGGEAAFTAIQGAVDNVIESVGEGKEYTLTFGMLLRRMASNLRRMVPRPTRLGGVGGGYEFADLTLDTAARLKKISWKPGGERAGWSFFREKCPLLVCSGLGDGILPHGVAKKLDCQGVEKDKGRLVAMVKCLKMIAEREQRDIASGDLSTEWGWYSPHAPFGDCNCMSYVCSRVQYIMKKNKMNQRPQNVAGNLSGAIIIGKYRRLKKRHTEAAASGGNTSNENRVRDTNGVEELDRSRLRDVLEAAQSADLSDDRIAGDLILMNNGQPIDQSSILSDETERSYVTAHS